MKTKFLFIILILSFVGLMAQQKAELQKADESGFIEVDEVPVLKSEFKPSYPEIARLAGIEGTVYLKVLVDEKGNVEKTKVEQGAKEILDNSALQAAKKAKFSPAMLNNKPVKVWVILPVAFKLDVGEKTEGKLLKYDELGKDAGKVPPIKMPEYSNPPKDQNKNDTEPDINAFVQVEKLPEMIEGAKPEYPEIAKRAGITGKVFVKVLVDKDGTPKKAIVIKSDSELFNQSAVDATLKSKFTPAINKGEAIAVWIVLPFKYMLEMMEITSSWFSTADSAATEYASLIRAIEQTGEYENIKHEKEKTKRLETDLKYGDESALFETEGKSYHKILFITRKGRGIVRTTQDSIDDLKQYIVKYMDKVFKDLEKKK